MALPPAAVFEASLEDVSLADAPAKTIARTRVASPGNPPIAFTIAYDPARILPDHRYVVRARILVDDKLLFTTDTATPVITGRKPNQRLHHPPQSRRGSDQAVRPDPPFDCSALSSFAMLNLARLGIEKQPIAPGPAVEIKHSIHRARQIVRRAIETSQAPIVFDEAK